MKYFELTGELREKALDILKRREAASKQCQELAAQYGGNGFLYGGMLTESVSGFCGECAPCPALRMEYNRQTKTHMKDRWVPNLSTREGKALARQLAKIELPGQADIAKLIGMNQWHDFHIRNPGIDVIGKTKRVIVIVPDDVEPVDGCVRIPDVEYEALQKASKRKTSRAKRVSEAIT